VKLCATEIEVVPNRRYIDVAKKMRTNTIVHHANFITQKHIMHCNQTRIVSSLQVVSNRRYTLSLTLNTPRHACWRSQKN